MRIDAWPLGASSRLLRATALTILTIAMAGLLGGCGVSGGSAPVDPAALRLIGDLEPVAPSEATVDAGDALLAGRAEGFGRPGDPEVSLVRARVASPEYPAISEGRVVWVFRWGNLGEERPKGFPPGPDGTPNVTVFVQNDYFLVIDAATGTVLFGLLL